MANPILYSPNLEHEEPEEFKTERELEKVLRQIFSITSKDYGHGVRSVHAKSHALLQAAFEVPPLPEHLAQGLFAKPGRYSATMRISTIPGDILDDRISVPRGLAMKIIDVDGERLPGSENDRTQDFVLVNAPAFAAPTAAKFLGNLKLLSKTTDKAEWAKRSLSTLLRGVEKGVEAVGLKSSLITTLGGHPLTSPAGETYYSQTPFRYGAYVAKFALVPVSPNLIAAKEAPIELSERDGLRKELNSFFASARSVWELRVQLLTNEASMPVEDASVEWPESESPYVTVGSLTAAPQLAWSEARSQVGDDQLAFSPWHGLEAHRPLGAINRLRKNTYKISVHSRATFNRCPISEPRQSVDLPG